MEGGVQDEEEKPYLEVEGGSVMILKEDLRFNA
jgi:hypothetical protein